MLAPMSSPLPPLGGDSDEPASDAPNDMEDEPPGEKTFVDPNVYDGKWDESTVEERGRRKGGDEAAVAPAARPARLRVTSGSDRGREFVLEDAETSIGRGTTNGIILTDLSVSRKHLVVLFDGKDYRLRDLGSGNGTFVNGDAVEGEAPLRDGDTVEIGKTILRFAWSPAGIDKRSAPARARPHPLSGGDVAGRQTLPLGTFMPAPAVRRVATAPPSSPGSPPPSSSATFLGSTSTPEPAPQNRTARILAVFVAGVGLLALGFGILALVGPRRQTRTVAVPIPAPVPVPVVAARADTSSPPAPAAPPTADVAPSVTPLAEEPRPAKPAAAKKRPIAEAMAPGEHPAERRAAVQYRDKQFAEAARILRAAADADPASAAHLNAMAKDFVAVGAGLARGDAAADASPAQSLVAYQEALSADLRAGGFHSSGIRSKIARVAPAAAAVYLGASRYEQARAACDLAQNFGAGGDARIGRVRSELESKARELYLAAQELARDKPAEARSLYRRITQIVPEGSPWHEKASSSLR
jgi:predicted component of type VI protein secretion system